MQTYTLNKIGTTRTWDYSLPTLQQTGRYTTRVPITNNTFCTKFYTEYPQFVNFNWNNICLKGGAIVDMVLGNPVNDLDFFFYGFVNDIDLIEKVKYVLNFFLDIERQHVEEANKKLTPYKKTNINITAVRRGSVITINLSAINIPIQLVMAHNDTIEQIMNETDLAVSGSVFDGKTVLISEDGKWELENMTIMIRNNMYPHASRIQKYYNKGFDIVFRELDIKKLPVRCLKYNNFGTSEFIETPAFSFIYSKIHDNKIELVKFISNDKEEKNLKMYDDDTSSDSRSILYNNIRTIAKLGSSDIKKTDIVLFNIFAESDFISDVLNPYPVIKLRQLINTYQGIAKEVYDDGILNLHKYDTFFKVCSLKNFLAEISTVVSNATDENIDKIENVVSTITRRQIEKSSDVLKEMDEIFQHETIPVIQRGKNNCCSLSNPEDFYGDYKIE